MAKYNGPKNRLSRREGTDLFGKGHKLRRATVPPGQHGPQGSKRLSGYGVQLREKQKVRRIYGIMEKQFRKYMAAASRKRGSTGEMLLRLLETRLDNIVFRLGLATTRAMARQLVGHGHVLVDGKIVSIPSYQVSVGEVIVLGPKIQKPEDSTTTPPAWLAREAQLGKIISLPNRADIDANINEQLIVEYYSR